MTAQITSCQMDVKHYEVGHPPPPPPPTPSFFSVLEQFLLVAASLTCYTIRIFLYCKINRSLKLLLHITKVSFLQSNALFLKVNEIISCIFHVNIYSNISVYVLCVFVHVPKYVITIVKKLINNSRRNECLINVCKSDKDLS